MLWQPSEMQFANFFAILEEMELRNLDSKTGRLGLITYAKYLLLPTLGNGTYPQKLFSGRSALIAIVIITCSARFKGLAFLFQITL